LTKDGGKLSVENSKDLKSS